MEQASLALLHRYNLRRLAVPRRIDPARIAIHRSVKRIVGKVGILLGRGGRSVPQLRMTTHQKRWSHDRSRQAS